MTKNKKAATPEYRMRISKLKPAENRPRISRPDFYVCNEAAYEGFLSQVAWTAQRNMEDNVPLFKVETKHNLWDVFLSSFAPAAVQHHNCRTCRKFIETYGSLVTVDPASGVKRPLLWDTVQVPKEYKPTVEALRQAVLDGKISGVFYDDAHVWGIPQTGEWFHLALPKIPKKFVYINKVKTPSQATAEKLEDYQTLFNALTEFPVNIAQKAYTWLTTAVGLQRTEKFEPMAKWFLDLHKTCASVHTSYNLLWYAVATAPVGFCHIKNTVYGSLMQDLKDCVYTAGDILKRFNSKVAPLQYQRPQAAPTQGNLNRAEALFKKMELETALARRFLTYDDPIEALWEAISTDEPYQRKQPKRAEGIFKNVQAKEPTNEEVRTVSWDFFLSTVLPNAASMTVSLAPSRRYPFCALVTAVHQDAEPILQWDSHERRNPVSWYLYSGGSSIRTFGLQESKNIPVKLVMKRPSQWYNDSNKNFPPAVIFALQGCEDTNGRISSGLFPEIIKSELREVRAVIESYSAGKPLESSHGEPVAGLLLETGKPLGSDFVFNVALLNGKKHRYFISA